MGENAAEREEATMLFFIIVKIVGVYQIVEEVCVIYNTLYEEVLKCVFRVSFLLGMLKSDFPLLINSSHLNLFSRHIFNYIVTDLHIFMADMMCCLTLGEADFTTNPISQ